VRRVQPPSAWPTPQYVFERGQKEANVVVGQLSDVADLKALPAKQPFAFVDDDGFLTQSVAEDRAQPIDGAPVQWSGIEHMSASSIKEIRRLQPAQCDTKQISSALMACIAFQ